MNATYNSYGTPIYQAFDEEWLTKVFTCPVCGWSGDREAMSGPNLFKECLDYECPKCGKMLLIVGYANYRETCEAAARGNREARFALEVMRGKNVTKVS